MCKLHKNANKHNEIAIKYKKTIAVRFIMQYNAY